MSDAAAPISLYNTLTRRVEPLVTGEPGHVRMYVCGVTVYDHAHIGHGRMITVFDVLARYLTWVGQKLTYVRNVTDIEDKIINRANEAGEPASALADRMTEAFFEDMEMLGCRRPTIEPRATEHIPEMVTLISQLEERGVAYRVDGDVYFSVPDYPAYGRLSNRRIEDLQAGARVEVGERKRHPCDFVLWKGAKPGEPIWESPFGDGRPGWHIECSAMASKYLGQPFDLHGGGEDLVFPHHENEIAQSEAASGTPFVGHWMHVAFLRLGEEKMSKSLGNFVTIRSALEEHPCEALRLALLQTHYRSPLEFAPSVIDDAKRSLVRLYETLARIDATGAEGAAEDAAAAATCRNDFRTALADDLNTPRALAALHDGIRAANRLLDAGRNDEAVALGAVLRDTGSVFGVLQGDPVETLQAWRSDRAAEAGLSNDQIEAIIVRRRDARAAKDFAAADAARDELLAAGIDLKDHPDGTTSWTLKRGYEG
ncbi:MAG: cysteine--tRNA ligase [Candidatus Binatia bacterium]|nr:cysteine--tRNA ligase [Candidatus Binatia bacterium]